MSILVNSSTSELSCFLSEDLCSVDDGLSAVSNHDVIHSIGLTTVLTKHSVSVKFKALL